MSIRNKSVAVLAGLAVFAVVSASAATLGGLSTNDLGANSNDVKAQSSAGVAISWTTAYDAALNGGDGAYKISGVTLTPAAPAGSDVKLTLKDSTGASLGEITTVAGVLTMPATAIAAHDVYGVSLVINGGTVTAAVDVDNTND